MRYRTLALGLALISVCLTSCTKTKLAYGFLDNWLRWETEKYLSPTDQQKQLLKVHSKNFHHWHRSNELESLAQFAGQTATLLDQPNISAEQVQQTLEQMQVIYTRSAKQLRKLTDALLPTLQPSQIDQIMAKLDQQAVEYQEQYLAVSKQQRIEDRAESMEDFFAGIVGKLNPQQSQLVLDWSDGITSLAAEGLLQQRLWQQEFAQALAEDRSDPTNLDKLASLIFTELKPLNDQQQKIEQANRQHTAKMIVTLHGTLTKKQRAKLQKRLLNYQRDFQQLALESAQR